MFLNMVPAASTTYTDQTILSGNVYYYVVTAATSDGYESKPSPEAKATVP